jgi:hypothetical protein
MMVFESDEDDRACRRHEAASRTRQRSRTGLGEIRRDLLTIRRHGASGGTGGGAVSRVGERGDGGCDPGREARTDDFELITRLTVLAIQR